MSQPGITSQHVQQAYKTAYGPPPEPPPEPKPAEAEATEAKPKSK